jgi:prepilin-type N-terminal cleavage/methylation domain-containing protein
MMKRLRFGAEEGFTLIELLVVIAIIGILAAIAIPQFAAYRRRGFERQVISDLKNAAIAEETYFADSKVYKACSSCAEADLPGFRRTPEVTVDATVAGQTLTLSATHAKCGADVWTYSNTTGGVTSPATPCE